MSPIGFRGCINCVIASPVEAHAAERRDADKPETVRSHMIEIRQIDEARREDVRLPNEPFPLFGRMIPRCADGQWGYTIERFDDVSEMCFPDENYSYEEMKDDSVFLGAYDGDTCIGLAILQPGAFRYMYLYDLKVNRDHRRRGVGKQLIEAAKAVAAERGYRGLYTQGQDNNLAACTFYLKRGFRIGGFDTEIYKGTNQEEKSDITFYLD